MELQEEPLYYTMLIERERIDIEMVMTLSRDTDASHT